MSLPLPPARRAASLSPSVRRLSRQRRRTRVVWTAAFGAILALSVPAAASADTTLKGFGFAAAFGVDIAGAGGPINPLQIPDAPRDASAAAVGAERTLVLTPAGVLSGGYTGLLGHGPASPGTKPLTLIPGTAGVEAVAIGGDALVLRPGGTVDKIDTATTPVTGLADIEAIAAGASFGLGVDSDGAVWAWGDARYLGTPDPPAVAGTPVKVALPVGSKAVKVAAGQNHALALLENGEVWAWGNDRYAQLGDGVAVNVNRTTPVKVQSLDDLGVDGEGEPVKVKSITAGLRTSLALLTDGTFRAWGQKGTGALGLGSGDVTGNQLVPAARAVTAPDSAYPAFSELVNVGFTTYALAAGGEVYAWGYQGGVDRRLGGTALHPIPYGSANPITETSDTEVPQRVGRLKNVPWLAVGGLGVHQVVLSDTVLRPFVNGANNSFYSQEIGTWSAVQQVRVESAGAASTITGVRIVGPNYSDFHLVRSDGTGNSSPFPIAVPQQRNVDFPIQFAPTGPGERLAELEVTSLEGEAIRVPLDGFGAPSTGGPRGEKGEKGDTIVVTVQGPPGKNGVAGPAGSISVASTRALTTVRRGRTAKLSFVLLNGTAGRLPKATASASVPRALRTTGRSSVTIPRIASGADRSFSVPVEVGRGAPLGTRKITVTIRVAGKTLRRTVRLRVNR